MFASDLHKHNKLSICLLNIIWGGICNVNKTTRWSKKFRDISQRKTCIKKENKGGGGSSVYKLDIFLCQNRFF